MKHSEIQEKRRAFPGFHFVPSGLRNWIPAPGSGSGTSFAGMTPPPSVSSLDKAQRNPGEEESLSRIPLRSIRATELKDIFAVQDEIVQKIVTTLKLQIPLMEQGYLVRKRTDNLEAYDAFLQGVESWHRTFSETKKELLERAQQRFEKAVDLDPQFAEAYAWLGQTYWLSWFYWPNPTLRTLEEAGELAQRAIALDGSLSLPHRVLADVYVWKKQHDQAIAEGERALALDPNDAVSYFAFGSVLVFAGRPEEGIGMIKQSMRLNPRYPITYLHDLGWAYRVAGRCEEAIIPLKKLLTLKPDFLPSHINLASCYAEMDRLERKPGLRRRKSCGSGPIGL